MYQIGDRVVYGIHGVCRVVETEERIVDRKHLTYLVLEPEGQEGARFLVPTHKEAAMAKLRPVLTARELEALLRSEEVRRDSWIPEENMRKQIYRSLISSGDRAALMAMVRTLRNQRISRVSSGKKFHICDENFLRDAEKLLSGEIALVLGLSADDAKTYLHQALSE